MDAGAVWRHVDWCCSLFAGSRLTVRLLFAWMCNQWRWGRYRILVMVHDRTVDGIMCCYKRCELDLTRSSCWMVDVFL